MHGILTLSVSENKGTLTDQLSCCLSSGFLAFFLSLGPHIPAFWMLGCCEVACELTHRWHPRCYQLSNNLCPSVFEAAYLNSLDQLQNYLSRHHLPFWRINSSINSIANWVSLCPSSLSSFVPCEVTVTAQAELPAALRQGAWSLCVWDSFLSKFSQSWCDINSRILPLLIF